jgi:hypothetical protein
MMGQCTSTCASLVRRLGVLYMRLQLTARAFASQAGREKRVCERYVRTPEGRPNESGGARGGVPCVDIGCSAESGECCQL